MLLRKQNAHPLPHFSTALQATIPNLPNIPTHIQSYTPIHLPIHTHLPTYLPYSLSLLVLLPLSQPKPPAFLTEPDQLNPLQFAASDTLIGPKLTLAAGACLPVCHPPPKYRHYLQTRPDLPTSPYPLLFCRPEALPASSNFTFLP